MPFYVVVDPPVQAHGRVQVWATPFPTREAAAAHAQRLSERCVVVVEAQSLGQAIQQVRAEQAPC